MATRPVRNRLLVGLLLGAACSRGHRPVASESGPPGTIPAPDPRVDGAAQTACLAGDTLLRRRPGLTVHWSPATIFDSLWRDSSTRWACHLVAVGKRPTAVGEVDSLLASLKARGWVDSTTISADGPDGTVQGVRRGEVTCLIEGRWDGGDDTDTAAVRSETVEIHLACTRTIPGDLLVPQ